MAARTVAAAEHADPGSTHRLLDQAARLDRSRARAVLDLAFPSPVYREFLHHVTALVDDGGV